MYTCKLCIHASTILTFALWSRSVHLVSSGSEMDPHSTIPLTPYLKHCNRDTRAVSTHVYTCYMYMHVHVYIHVHACTLASFPGSLSTVAMCARPLSPDIEKRIVNVHSGEGLETRLHIRKHDTQCTCMYTCIYMYMYMYMHVYTVHVHTITMRK